MFRQQKFTIVPIIMPTEALAVTLPVWCKDQSMRAYEYLYKSFEQTNQQDSLNKYFRRPCLQKIPSYSGK